MSVRLREFIKAVRGAKTQAEEKQLFLKEKGSIHESFLKNEGQHRARNIAKLLFINMSGYDTDFGQMQILNLITSEDYLDKKIGYLGLTQLFCENSEVLMLATHSLRKDLDSSNQYVVHLALVALSEICTSDMCLALAPLLSSLLKKNNAYLRKQATLAATRVVRKCPDNASLFAERIDLLLK